MKTALKVVETLEKGGFEAYIVGGAVRDLLLGKAPHDIDVATNAAPQQVKSFFLPHHRHRNCPWHRAGDAGRRRD
nr:hypothetical protein [Planococcus glaciei]